MTIHYSYTIRYKRYANAPKATQDSLELNRMYTWPMYVCIVFANLMLGFFISAGAFKDEQSPLGFVFAALLTVGMIFLMFRRKRRKEDRLDAEATRESLVVRDMTAEELAQYKVKLAKAQKLTALKRLLILFAGMIVYFAICFFLAFMI